MTTPTEIEPIARGGATAHRAWGTLGIFTATTFLSAFLLFLIQPMFAKMVLPLLGGAPSVWAVALLFFQGALLVGYGYAHLLVRHVPAASTGFVHLALSALAFLFLPIAIPAGWSEPPPGDAYLWQLGLFAVAIGIPFAAVSANAPLLQAWFSRAGHKASADPYFLYAASNLGSLIALLGYPFIFEPVFGLKALAIVWTAGFAALVVALGLCFLRVRAVAAEAEKGADAASPASAPSLYAPTWNARVGWVGLAFVPSALLTAFTNHIATDVASAPLVWVVPLALYLLTFVIVFRERALISRPVLLTAHAVAVLLALLQLSQTEKETWFYAAGYGIAAFVASTLVAHRTLYEARPDARNLTEFYMWMSVGGVLGGIFAALLAPRIFSEVFEYPLLLALTFACRPGALALIARSRQKMPTVLGYSVIGLGAALLARFYRSSETLTDLAYDNAPFLIATVVVILISLKYDWRGKALVLLNYTFGIALITWGPTLAFDYDLHLGRWGTTTDIAAIFALVALALWYFPPHMLVAALGMYLTVVLLPSGVHRGDAQRSYFGVYRVIQSMDGEFNVLQHGTTLHGAQRIRDAEGNSVADVTPATYYHPESPMASAIRLTSMINQHEGVKGKFGVIGLGAGSLACYSAPGETWRFFEIDPVVVQIAKSRNFTFLSNCQPNAEVVLGDARLTFAREEDESFDLFVVDAFSSDAIPVHMMTAEALTLYASKLKKRGVAVLHISNRYLDLEEVLAATLPTLDVELHALVIEDFVDDGYIKTGSTVVLIGKDKATIERFRHVEGSRDIVRPTVRPWTDDFSDILGPFMAQYRKY